MRNTIYFRKRPAGAVIWVLAIVFNGFAGCAAMLSLIWWLPRNSVVLAYAHSDAASFVMWCLLCGCGDMLLFVPLPNVVVREL